MKSLLTNREREVFELLVQDKTTKEIAGLLFVSEKTVRNHISKEIWLLREPQAGEMEVIG
jgi:LuxR family transcriptional regulator of spore coat protein